MERVRRFAELILVQVGILEELSVGDRAGAVALLDSSSRLENLTDVFHVPVSVFRPDLFEEVFQDRS